VFSYPFHVQGWLPRVLRAGTGGDPMVLVHGTGARADRWARNLDADAANKITPDSRLSLIERAAHSPHLEKLEELSALLLGFFPNSARSEPASEATVPA
jgi:pimeloyl-ACP methyl ester carboxylesterase